MRRIHPQHVFLALMMLAAASAFVIPPQYVDRFVPRIEGLVAPVSRPVGVVAGWVNSHFSPQGFADRRQVADIKAENEEIRTTLAGLQMQLDYYKRVDKDRSSMGALRDLCTPVPVVGGDTSTRGSLAINGSSLQGLKEGQPVLYPYGVVGTVSGAGAAGTRVRLITDTGFRIRGIFGTFRREPVKADEAGDGSDEARGEVKALKGPGTRLVFTPLDKSLHVLVEGDKGRMVIRSVLELEKMQEIMADARKASPGEDVWVVVDDPEWPESVRGRRLGRVVSYGPHAAADNARGYAGVHLDPPTNLMQLKEVMVMTKP